MHSEPTTQTKRQGWKRPLVIFGGCVLLALVCIVGALAVNAAYWTYRYTQGTLDLGPAVTSIPAEFLQQEVEALPPGEAAAGEAVFNGNGCQGCHSLEPGVNSIGPSLDGIATTAATRRPDTPAELYLYESIISPNAYVVEGFPAGIMPQNFQQQLSEQELADLLAFLFAQ